MQPFGQVEPIGRPHFRWTIDLRVRSWKRRPFSLRIAPTSWSTGEPGPLAACGWTNTRASGPRPQELGTEMTLEYYIDFSHVPAGDLLSAILSFFGQADQKRHSQDPSQ